MRALDLDVFAVELCLITHFHADHFFDLVILLLEKRFKKSDNKRIIVIAPPGAEENMKQLVNLAYPGIWQRTKAESGLEIIEVDDGKVVDKLGYQITAYRVEHEDIEAFGYVVEKSGYKAGFTGDSVLCSGIEQIIKQSNIAFIDTSFIDDTSGHMGAKTYQKLVKRYRQTCQVLPTHMSDDAREYLINEGYDMAVDGDNLIIDKNVIKESER